MGFPGGSALKNSPVMQEPQGMGFDPWVGKIPWRRAWPPTPVILAWRVPWTEEPSSLQSMGWQRFGHN